VIKNDIINEVGEAAGVSRQKATQAVETIIEVMRQALARGERIELRGFGVFLVKPRKKGIGRNPKKPQDEVQIPPGYTIRFKPGKELRDLTEASAAQAPAEPPGSPETTPPDGTTNSGE
jgi:DNA-binding protein HU-beta